MDAIRGAAVSRSRVCAPASGSARAMRRIGAGWHSLSMSWSDVQRRPRNEASCGLGVGGDLDDYRAGVRVFLPCRSGSGVTMDQNFEALRKTAEAATPGPWTRDGVGVLGAREDWDGGKGPARIMKAMMPWRTERMEANAEHVATFNPETVLALLSRLEQAEQQVQAVLRLADSWETGALRWEDPLRVPNEVFLLRKALHQPTHEPDWTDYQLGDPGASCSCGYNGPYKECWQSRRALDGDSNE